MGNWKMQLVSPKGEVVDVGSMGNASGTFETTLAIREIVKYLEECNTCGKDLVLMGPDQMMLNQSLRRYHNFRLAWGDNNPGGEFSCYPNGKDLNWKLYWIGGGLSEVVLEGTLPSEWWTWDDEERYTFLRRVCGN